MTAVRREIALTKQLTELREAARALLGNKKLMHMHGAICIIGAPADNWDALAAALLEVKGE